MVPALFAVLAFCVLATLEARVNAAQAREDLGLTRGQIVDQLGNSVANTVELHYVARRLYRLPDASHVIGYQDPAGRWHGLERTYSHLLSGIPGENGVAAFLQHLRGRSASGGTLGLTIVRSIQAAAASALGTHEGAVVAIEPSTGAILALVSAPSCPAGSLTSTRTNERCSSEALHPLRNRAIDMVLAPGSIFKIVTLSAALDSGRFHLSDVFSGADIFGPSPYFDNVRYPSNVTRPGLTALTLEQALAFSDNFTFAHVGLTLGGHVLLQYAHRFYIGRHIPFEYPVAVSRIAGGSAHPSMSDVARSSFGATVDGVTPLQMAMVASAVANHGVLMAPHLTAFVQRADSRVKQRTPARSLGRVMSAQTARDVTTAMIFVVDHGSGFNAAIPGVEVAGKTGTAADHGSKPHAWFIAFAPARHPKVAVAVLREYAGEGFQYAAPIARKVLLAALRAQGIPAH